MAQTEQAAPSHAAEQPTLQRSLGLFQTTAVGVAIIVGAGIYVLIGEAAERAGSALWLSFLLSGLAATFTALSYAELSSRYPKAGAAYNYT
ncbi:MAG: amino acid permease, partial [Chloroflexi bacterium]|nr:amino acid permease [Chloroflexota bacterium]